MALTKNIVTEKTYYSPMSIEDFVVQKKVHPNAYIKIDSLDGNKNMVKLLVFVYDEKDGKVIEKKSFNFSPALGNESANFIQQGYEYLKTLPEFSGAVDC